MAFVVHVEVGPSIKSCHVLANQASDIFAQILVVAFSNQQKCKNSLLDFNGVKMVVLGSPALGKNLGRVQCKFLASEVLAAGTSILIAKCVTKHCLPKVVQSRVAICNLVDLAAEIALSCLLQLLARFVMASQTAF